MQKSSGTEPWSTHYTENRLLTAPIINGYVVVGDTEGYLHWLDRSSGEFVAQQLLMIAALRSAY